MKVSNCEECPWTIKNNNNNNFTDYSKKHDKSHNCHMVEYVKRGLLWDTKDNYICRGYINWKKTK